MLNAQTQRDTPFASLMQQRVYNVLLLASPYDAFMLEEDGRVDEQIYNEYNALGLRYAPRFTMVNEVEEALQSLATLHYELIIVMPRRDGSDAFHTAARLRKTHPNIPLVVLTPFSKEVSRTLEKLKSEEWESAHTSLNYVFAWLGNPDLLLAIIKLVEDRMNAPHDTAAVGVQTILLVEDSVRFYSSALPCLYRIVLEQSLEFSKEALNEHLKMLRMRGRPKVMLARTYEEAISIYQQYRDNLLGVVTDMSFEREGKKDPQAGAAFVQELRRFDPNIPVVVASSDAGNRTLAETLHTTFIEKNAKTFPHELRRALMNDFGFGPFRIKDPRTGRTLLSINTLQELLHSLRRIPDHALGYHLARNDFSRFFYSRAMFPPAEILRGTHVSQYASPEAARAFIREVIADYRRIKNDGVVAIYQRDRFDEFAKFTRIGSGSLGGKGRGLAFMASLLHNAQCTMHNAQSAPPHSSPLTPHSSLTPRVPNTVILCTDIFDEFLEAEAGLYELALRPDTPDEEIRAAFLRTPLPPRIIDDLRAFLRQMKGRPIAVRSSSLLEDSHYQPFAGVYQTVMLAPIAEPDAMFAALCDAIREVYASVFYQESKRYLTATQNLIDEEKMAIVLQEVTVDETLPALAPTVSGVARSLSFYPPPGTEREDGVAELALGLGAYVVDAAGPVCRFTPRHPEINFSTENPRTALRDTQRKFFALALAEGSVQARAVEDRSAQYGLQTLPLTALFNTEPSPTAPASTKRPAAAAPLLFSTYSISDDALYPGLYPGMQGRPVLTFAGLLSPSSPVPLAETLSRLLTLGEQGMGRPVEIEFALNLSRLDAPVFHVLQIRPMVNPLTMRNAQCTMHNAQSNAQCTMHNAQSAAASTKPSLTAVISSTHVLGCDTLRDDIEDVIYVPTAHFDASHNEERARCIRSLTQQLEAEGRQFLLIGPGRWGSSDPWLGIPVRWSDIAQAAAIVECQIEGYCVEPSQGTHFFQNLTSAGVPYITIEHGADGDFFHETLLDAVADRTNAQCTMHNAQWAAAHSSPLAPNSSLTPAVRHVRLPKPLSLWVDGRKGKAIINTQH